MNTHSYNWRYAALATIACMIGGPALVLLIEALLGDPLFGQPYALFSKVRWECPLPPQRQQAREEQAAAEKWAKCVSRSGKETMRRKWVLVDSTPTGRAEVDTLSIVRHDDQRMAWVRITYTADAVEEHAGVHESVNAGDQALIESEYNCESRESRDLNLMNRYRPNGFIAIGAREPPFHAVAPGTLDEAALTYVCQHAPVYWWRDLQ